MKNWIKILSILIIFVVYIVSINIFANLISFSSEKSQVTETTTGSAVSYGMLTGVGINPILNEAGSFGNVETAFVSVPGFTDVTAAFNSTGTDVQMFVANSDLVYIGMAALFDEVEFILAITASNAGIKPTFEYSDGASGWTSFSPTDNTNGMRQNGDLVWIELPDDYDGHTYSQAHPGRGSWNQSRYRGDAVTEHYVVVKCPYCKWTPLLLRKAGWPQRCPNCTRSMFEDIERRNQHYAEAAANKKRVDEAFAAELENRK